jgi:hypothetical protein
MMGERARERANDRGVLCIFSFLRIWLIKSAKTNRRAQSRSIVIYEKEGQQFESHVSFLFCCQIESIASERFTQKIANTKSV